MRALRIFTAASAISAAVGDGHSRGGSLRRGVQTGATPLPYRNVTCDIAAGETPCHDEVGTVVNCATPNSGGVCPCIGIERRCESSMFGDYCDTVCCDWESQERCHVPDSDGSRAFDVWCADVDEGGCPCPKGEVKCGGDLDAVGGSSGYCTSLCCDAEAGEQTCYDHNYDPSFCAFIDEGGCPCPEGQTKCGGDEDWAGYCTEACCDLDEEACYDAKGKKSCAKHSTGGCSAATSHVRRWQSEVESTILTRGTGGQVAYYASIRNRRQALLSKRGTGSPHTRAMMKNLEEEEAALFHAIRLGKIEKDQLDVKMTSIA